MKSQTNDQFIYNMKTLLRIHFIALLATLAVGSSIASAEENHVVDCFVTSHAYIIFLVLGVLAACFSVSLFLLFRMRKKLDEAIRIARRPECKTVSEAETSEKEKELLQKYADIVNAITDGYIEIDLQGDIKNLNHEVALIFKCEINDLIGEHYSRLLSVTDSNNITNVFSSIFITGQPEEIKNIEVTGKDNKKRIVSISASLMRTSKGNPEGFRCIVRDISALYKAENNQDLLRAQLQRSQQIEAIGTLAGGIAHDFNNLLMAIQGNTSILLFNMTRDNPLYSKLINIENCIHSGAELTKQLLGFARGKKSTISIININDIAKETANTFKRTKKAIQLEEKYINTIGRIEADQGQIKQVILNLFINIWQTSPDKKRIYIQTGEQACNDEVARKKGICAGTYSTITISNYEADTKPIEGHQPASDIKTGINAGIGITSSSEVVKSYDGIIEFIKHNADETAYTVYMPVSERKKTEDNPVAPVQENGTGTVLFVDDEEMIIEVGKPMLEELGYDVLVARGGEEAITVYEINKGKIDLVILDMVMPRVDGGDVYNILKKMDPKVKTLLSSGYALDEKADTLLNNGCNGFIQKPFNLKRLSQQIKIALTDY